MLLYGITTVVSSFKRIISMLFSSYISLFSSWNL